MVMLRPRAFMLSLAGILSVAALLYWPGLQGGFVFDDVFNLSPLGRQGGIGSLDQALAFVFGNHSGPAGRPLSMASFLLDAQDWPADPYPFKRTNLMLHLLCAGLLAYLMKGLLRQIGHGEREAAGAALLCAALWVMHPLQVSTVLYVIQRMTILSSLCVLAGLLCYWHGRCGRARSMTGNMAWMIGGFGLGIGLGVLAKENAILMAAYALVIEWVLASRLPAQRRLVLAARGLAMLPLLVAAAYLAYRVANSGHAYEWRGWTAPERLLTQSRILLDYLQQIVLPDAGRMGLAHDDWVVSRSLWSPPDTIWSMLGVIALCAVAVLSRYRAPLLALAIAWFFAGHLLESTVLPLELYFEHRNYLPMAGILLLVSVLLVRLFGYLAAHGYRRACWLPVVLPVMLLFMPGYGLTTLWGKPLLLEASWAKAHPDSARAQKYLARGLELAGDTDAAYAHMVRVFEARPDRLDVGVSALSLQCKYNITAPMTVQGLIEQSRIENVSFDLYSALSGLLKLRLANDCQAISLDELERLILHVGNNEQARKNGLFISRVFFDYADLKITQRDFFAAIRALETAYRARPSLDIALKLSVIWSTGGQYEQALRWLMIARLHDQARSLFVPSRERELGILEAGFSKHLQDAGLEMPAGVQLSKPPYVVEQ